MRRPRSPLPDLMVFRQMMQGFGLDIADDGMLERVQKLASVYQKCR